MMPQRNATHRRGLKGWIAPDQRPVFLVVAVSECAEALSDGLRFGIAQTSGDAIKNVVVAAKPPVGIDARIISAFVQARDRSLPDVAEVDDTLSVGKN